MGSPSFKLKEGATRMTLARIKRHLKGRSLMPPQTSLYDNEV
jgi:hypothetical protein